MNQYKNLYPVREVSMLEVSIKKNRNDHINKA